jgi:DNA-binding GntR family transcriptional regulator
VTSFRPDPDETPLVDRDGLREAIEALVATADLAHRTAEDKALFVLRTAIDRGLFRPGERLPQDRLASLVGSSRMPVRAALRQLESEGYVTLEPHRGAVVRTVLESEIRDLFEIRILVESFALKRVAMEADAADLERLNELAESIDSAANDQERIDLMDEFYRRLYRTANTPRIVALVMQLRSEVNRYSRSHGYRKETHRELLDALGMDDPDLSAAWLAAHLRKLARRAVEHGQDTEGSSDADEG